MQQGIEKRESRRANLSSEVQFEWGSSTVRTQMRNLSLGGMLVELASPLWVGAEFDAWIELEGGPLRAHCVVRRVVSGVGNGVEFVEMSPEDLNRLRQSLEKLPY